MCKKNKFVSGTKITLCLLTCVRVCMCMWNELRQLTWKLSLIFTIISFYGCILRKVRCSLFFILITHFDYCTRKWERAHTHTHMHAYTHTRFSVSTKYVLQNSQCVNTIVMLRKHLMFMCCLQVEQTKMKTKRRREMLLHTQDHSLSPSLLLHKEHLKSLNYCVLSLARCLFTLLHQYVTSTSDFQLGVSRQF